MKTVVIVGISVAVVAFVGISMSLLGEDEESPTVSDVITSSPTPDEILSSPLAPLSEKEEGPFDKREEQAEQTGKEQKSTCKGTALCLNKKVTRIVDGDTIYLGVYKIRISLTDTPEKNNLGFSEATEFTANLCPVGSTVIVDQDDLQPIDPYGRILGKVFCGNKILNSELLENGHAVISTKYCSTSEFSNEEWAIKYGC